MSIFDDHIAIADDIILQHYDIQDGVMRPSYSRGASESDLKDGSFMTKEAAWEWWSPERIDLMELAYRVRVDHLSKKKFMKYLDENVEKIKQKSYHGEIYYRWRDLRMELSVFEVLITWEYCDKHGLYWGGPLPLAETINLYKA